MGSGYGGMVEFHSRHKLLILSHSEKIYREIGASGGARQNTAF